MFHRAITSRPLRRVLWAAALVGLGLATGALWRSDRLSSRPAAEQGTLRVKSELAEMLKHPNPHQPTQAALQSELDAMRARSGDPHQLRLRTEKELERMQHR